MTIYLIETIMEIIIFKVIHFEAKYVNVLGRNVSRKQQSFSGFQSPKWSFSIKAIKILCFSGFSYLVLCLRFSLFFNKRECSLFYMCLKLPLNLGI